MDFVEKGLSWEEIVANAKDYFGENLIDISRFIGEKKHLNLPTRKDLAEIPISDIDILYDDFSTPHFPDEDLYKREIVSEKKPLPIETDDMDFIKYLLSIGDVDFSEEDDEENNELL